MIDHRASLPLAASSSSARAARQSGFTLMEVLAAVFLTSIVLAVAIGFYINLSDASTRAARMIREGLHATAVLDRIARDLEGAALLVKPDEVDPLSHPWFFTAASEHAFDGADRLKFISRSQKHRAMDYHSSDLALVAYFLEREEDESYTLYRWVSPGLPIDNDPIFPSSEDPRSLVLAEGLRGLSMRFMQEDGEWVDEWDSSQLVQSSMLPVAVEIELSILGEDEAAEMAFDQEERPAFGLHVMLPQRPIDLEAMKIAKIEKQALAAAGLSGDESDEDAATDETACADATCSVTKGDCLAQNPGLENLFPQLSQFPDCACADKYLGQLSAAGITCR